MDIGLSFSSRRSPVVCLHGCAASSQPLASNVGLDVLKRGGNAADAAVAIAAALAVTEPCSTGPGGDAFCLFYDVNTGEIRGLNGSGRSPRAQTLELLEGRGYTAEAPPSPFDALNVTVPGAPACWCDAVQQFGSHKLSFQEVLSGAVEIAEVGFPVAEVTAHHWAKWVAALRDTGKELGGDLLIDNHAPKCGQVFRNPALAQTLKDLGERGKPAFYQGRVAQAIIDIISQHGGVMTLDDLSSHDSEVITPISTEYKGVHLWEPPPNSQGLAALLLLNILENFPLKAMAHNSADYVHVLVESVRLALTDALCYLGDPDHMTLPLKMLLDKGYSHQRAQNISMDRAMEGVEPGPITGSDTVYFCNRGASFSLRRNHVNSVAAGKRPYHTIIPALLTSSTATSHKPRLLAALGVMGALMQPQGHIQVQGEKREIRSKEWRVNLEEGVDQEVAEELKRRGHKVNWPITGHTRSQFGRGQIITVGDWWNPSVNQADHPTRVLWAGSDPRGDGCAQGY
ncbi:hypothetical protein INR49_023967 [Caranx melampygus]|nr:hypothetical protein INR49_023967 [Caranx melampygus]